MEELKKKILKIVEKSGESDEFTKEVKKNLKDEDIVLEITEGQERMISEDLDRKKLKMKNYFMQLQEKPGRKPVYSITIKYGKESPQVVIAKKGESKAYTI